MLEVSHGQTIGIVGGGQLGRMLTLAAVPLGFAVVVVDPEDRCPAQQAGADQIVADLHDRAALTELGRRADHVTIEIEHVDAAALEDLVDGRTAVNPFPSTIALLQDKLRQKELLAQHGIAVAPFWDVPTIDAARARLASDGPLVLKTRRGGYDGRGNAVVTDASDLDAAWARFDGTALYAEALVDFTMELAVMVAIDGRGGHELYPVVQTINERNICLEVHAPAPIEEATRRSAVDCAQDVAAHLEGAGVYGIEMFVTRAGDVLINEIAPRVHNSGHYTMDACVTSQFEQHIRAIAGLPLGSTAMHGPAAAMINILGERDGPTEVRGLDKVLSQPRTKVHLYGKSPTKVDRKMGHINVTAESVTAAAEAARAARRGLEL
jgi:5-(carboxyamino)imidazole ribonucleotide synthase